VRLKSFKLNFGDELHTRNQQKMKHIC
jgi:hypothetical protein